MGVGRVLLVDDDQLVLEAQARGLSRAGFEVEAVSNGHTALERLDSTSFDVVLTDLAMPELSGTQLLQAIRLRDSALPVVLLTGAPTLDSAIAAVEHGALRYLTKPVPRDELVEALRRAIGLGRIAKLQQEAFRLVTLDSPPGETPPQAAAVFERGLSGLWLATQPIVSLATRDVVAYEALLRTNEPTIPHPPAFLRLAKEVHGGVRLGRRIRAQAAHLAQDMEPDTTLFVNLCPEDLLDEALFDPHAPLSREAHRVVLEITERTSLDSLPDVAARLNTLRELGYRLAIDDLGSGYSGLNSLAQLDPDVAKIDMTLVRDVDSDGRRSAIVAGLVRTCQTLGLTVVVEGVETDAERDHLASLGCDLLQGFRFAKPAQPPTAVRTDAFESCPAELQRISIAGD